MNTLKVKKKDFFKEPLESGVKTMIINLYKHKITRQPDIKYDVLMKSMSKETGIPLDLIKTTMSEYKSTRSGRNVKPKPLPEKKNPPTIKDKIKEFDKTEIRRKIHEFWFIREIPTFHKLHKVILENPQLPNLSQKSLKQVLKEMNFRFSGKNQNSALIESDYTLLWRHNYLRDIRRYRSEGRTIYYLDELCVNVDDFISNAKTKKNSSLSQPSEELKNLTAKGKFMIFIHIGSTEGFVEGGLLCFESEKDEMNDNTFYEWFCGVLPRLNDNCIIVMDNAAYHSVKKDPIPTMDWKKENIIKWLVSRNCVVDNSMLMCELIKEVKKIQPLYDKYLLDEEALKTNKVVLRIPPYHNELNPVELVWLMVTNYVKKNIVTYKLTDLQKLFNDGLQTVTPDMWDKIISHTIEEEDKLYEINFTRDELLDAALDEMQSARDTSDFSD